MKKKLGQAVGGAAATAAIPVSFGGWDWRILAGFAGVGAVGGFFGVNVSQKIKAYLALRKAKKEAL